MNAPLGSLRRRAVVTMGAILAIAAIVAATVSAAMYQAVFERSARNRSATIVAFFEEKLHRIGLAWEDRLMTEKARLEFAHLMETRSNRWDRLRAYLASLSASPTYAGLAISAADGTELFRHSPEIAQRWPMPDPNRGEARTYLADGQGRLYVALTAPIWLGPDGMGAMHLIVPLDNGFLRENAFPDTELFVEWQGRVVAGSEGDGKLERAQPGYSGTIRRGGQRFEQRQMPFPQGANAPALLAQTRIAPPFSVAESIGVGVVVFVVLALLLSTTLHGWLVRFLPRIERLGRAARLFADEGRPTPVLTEVLNQAAGTDGDELGAVAHAMQDMMAAVALRNQERLAAEDRLKESERLFRDVAESAGEFVWEIDARQVLTYVSDGAAPLFGRPVDELRGSDFLGYLPPEERAPLMERVRRVASLGEPFRRIELTVVRPDGSRSILSFSGTPVIGDNGRRTGSYRGTAEDVTQRKRDEESLLLAEKVFAHSDQAILITAADATIVMVNPAFSAITGYTAEEAIGKNPNAFSSGRHDAAFYRAMWAELHRSGAWEGEVWDRRKNGAVFPKWLTINAVRHPENGSVSHYVGIFSDISERKENEARIEHLAYHDPLTGLPNRYALHARLQQSLADARRNDHPLAVMFIDLDRFKTINDSLGHDVGDQLLVAVAGRIRACLRETDTVARLGGDEFVIVVPGLAGPEDAARVAEKVIAEVGEPLVLSGHALHTSPSIGIGIFPSDGDDAEALMKHADAAMYHAKQQGRNAYRFFTADMNVTATERLLLESQLYAALDRGEFHLLYQPQVDLGTGLVVGVEALARWQHPDRGLILPEKFIPVAEETGLIIPLGAWVLEEACRQAMAWRAAGLPPLRLAVNVSVHQFHDRHFARHVGEILERTGMPAADLELEITESAVMKNVDQALEVMRMLGDLGVRLAIDDFGTGYSSMAYLKRLPIRRLKIDRSFVMDLEVDPNDVAITEGIVALARSMGLAVTAEGIETGPQLQIVREFGCAEGQGFLFNRPLTAAALAATLPVPVPAAPLIDQAPARSRRRLH